MKRNGFCFQRDQRGRGSSPSSSSSSSPSTSPTINPPGNQGRGRGRGRIGKQKRLHLPQNENEGINEPCRKQIGRLASSSSLRRSWGAVDSRWLIVDRKTAARCFVYQHSTIHHQLIPGRVSSNRYPDFGLQTLLPPSRPSRTCVIDSGSWEFVFRYSGATVAESHGVPCI